MAIKFGEIEKTKDRVERILFTNKEANRNDDFLYWLVCEEVANENGFDINNMKAPVFILHSRSMGMPGYETVRRTRQKVQEQYPALKGNNHSREESERNFRAFARSDK